MSSTNWERVVASDVRVGDTVARVRDLDRAETVTEVRPGETAVRLVTERGSIRPRKDSQLWRLVQDAPEAEEAPEAAESSHHASPVIAALEDAWAAVQERHPEVPDVVIITGTGVDPRRSGLRRGHYWHDTWQNGEGKLPEVFIAGERMADGAVGVLTTLIHEAAHGLAKVRGIKDTSRQGRYHNRRFKALAEELGLEVTQDPTIGWSPTTMPEETEREYAEVVAELTRALDIHRPQVADVTQSNGRRSTPPAVCGCGRKIRVAPSVLEQAPITCGSCGEDFAVEEVF